MYLLDTNILLELLLKREHANSVMYFLQTPGITCSISDFSFHSIGLFLFNKDKKELYLRFANDMFKPGGLKITSLLPEYLPELVHASDSYNLDFDDAYQYTITKSQNLTLVSYDNDFNKTPEKRVTPEEILNLKGT
jgi:Predicted nucleic acid-binding protein, contains PIN domain